MPHGEQRPAPRAVGLHLPCPRDARCGGILGMSTRRLWNSLTETSKQNVARAIAQSYQPEGLPPELVKLVAGTIGFRPSTVRRGDVEQTASFLYRAMPTLPHDAATTLLVRYFTDARAELLSDVYEALGAEHDGTLVEDAVLARPLDTAAALSGVAALVGTHTAGDLHFCFSVMEHVCTPTWRPTVVAVKAFLEGAPTPVLAET